MTESRTHSPFLLEGWVRFSEWLSGLTAVRRELRSGEARLESVYYHDGRGRVRLPALTPYLPIAFSTGAIQLPPRVYSQWDVLAGMLADEMRSRGVVGTIPLDPTALDARQWRWRGFDLGVAYTFQSVLPWQDTLADPAPKRQARKAERDGFTCERTQAFEQLTAVLRETETRQGFTHGLRGDALHRLNEGLGGDAFRAYVCRASDGSIASTRLVLWTPGSAAVDWVVATSTAQLKSGATQLLVRYVLDDLARAGATLFDFEGADIRGVAAAKQDWGGELVSYPTIRAHGIGRVLDDARQALLGTGLGERVRGPVRRIKRLFRR